MSASLYLATLLDYLDESKAVKEYWQNSEGTVYATVENGQHLPLSGRSTKTIALALSLFKEAGIVKYSLPKVKEVIDLWAAHFQPDAPVCQSSIRVGAKDSALYINLMNPEAPFVKVTAEGWEIVTSTPIKFLNPTTSLPMPVPSKNGDLKRLSRVLNYGSDSNLMRMAAWLIGSFHPTGPYAILSINGQQGSAKSSNCRALRMILDPNLNTLREPPSKADDFKAIVKNNHVVALDNISYIKNEFSDSLCRLCYGEAIGGRKLYTDDDDAAFAAARPVLLNGIPDMGDRPDLADRMLSVHLPTIDPHNRQTDTAIRQTFEAELPFILGGLMDHLVAAMRNYYTVRLQNKPRMVEFVQWVGGAFLGMKSWSVDDFVENYASQMQDSLIELASTDEVIQAINRALDDGIELTGTSPEVFAKVEPYKLRSADNFPRTTRGWGNAIKRLQPVFAHAAIGYKHEVKRDQTRGKTARIMHLYKL